MKQIRVIKLNVILLLAAALYGVPSSAAVLNIWPVKLLLWPEFKSDVVHISNRGSEKVNIQVYAKTWDMDENGRFIESDTGDFVFFPRLLTLQPDEERVVRVGYNGDFPLLEKSYRLYVEELPPVLPPEQQESGFGLRYQLRLSVPIFVMPTKEPPEPEVDVDEIRAAAKTVKLPLRSGPFAKSGTGEEVTREVIRVGVRASGTHHVQVNLVELQWLDKDAHPVASGESSGNLLRVLPHRRVFVDVPRPKSCKGASSLSVNVHLAGLQTAYSRSFKLTGGRCYP